MGSRACGSVSCGRGGRLTAALRRPWPAVVADSSLFLCAPAPCAHLFRCFPPVDFQTKEDSTVTIRERDSMQQIRVALKDAVPLVVQLTSGNITWAQAYESNVKFSAGANE